MNGRETNLATTGLTINTGPNLLEDASTKKTYVDPPRCLLNAVDDLVFL